MPEEEIFMEWGDEPGQVGRENVFGPCCFDIMPDGSVVVDDVRNLRIQLFDGFIWYVLHEFAAGGPTIPDGVAALDNGLIAVPTVPRGDSLADRLVLLLDDEGVIVDQGLARTFLNNAWWGREDLWSAQGSPPFTEWVRVTESGSFIPRENQRTVDSYSDSKASLHYAYDRRGDFDTEYNLTSVTLTVGSDTSSWTFYGGDIAGALQVEIDGERFIGLWMADPFYVVTVSGHEYETRAFLINRSQEYETGTFNSFRVHDGSLYLLQTYRDGARIEIFPIGD